MQKRHVIFLVDRTTVEAEPQEFKAGQVYELVEPSCERWIKRDAARYATDDEIKAAAKKAKAKPGKAVDDAAQRALQASALQADIGQLEQHLADIKPGEDGARPTLEAELEEKRAALAALNG